ncbi:MAG: hypothetical protein AAF329_20080, partial [Cyanobacteria bacterium P01_A01_bin.17]
MNTPLGDDLVSSSTEELPDLLKLSIQAAQLTFPTLHYAGRLLSDSSTVEDCHLQLIARDDSG